MSNTELNKNIEEIFKSDYVVPLYQRNFAWREDQISTLLQDIYENFKKTEGKGNYFIGSLIVLKRNNGSYEVIDGQQRLTTLSLITKLLGINNFLKLSYDSRPEVEKFFELFYEDPEKVSNLNNYSIFHLKNAIQYIFESQLDEKNEKIKLVNKNWEELSAFIEYFKTKVYLVRVEIPQDTDVASYFEIMNNRGEQLKKHEILKSLLIERIKDEKGQYDIEKQKQFAQIWDACAQMNYHIQQLFYQNIKDSDGHSITINDRSLYFGPNYDQFLFLEKKETKIEKNTGYTINEILNDKVTQSEYDNYFESSDEDDSDIENELYESIIDFPNFLMHVLKVYYGTVYEKIKSEEIPLNEKYLLDVFYVLKDEIKPMDFIHQLFYLRTISDKYIVKTILDSKSEDGKKWCLHKPVKYDNGKNKSWKYGNTFSDEKEQSRIIKAITMLQTTYRNRIYKNWFQEILCWFSEKENKSLNISYSDYITKLDEIILSSFERTKLKLPNVRELKEKEEISKENTIALGTETPHFLFNLIDYLYWIDKWWSKDTKKREINDFDFKYWNSVEHHFAREYAKEQDSNNYENYIDNLGNLCLISKNVNSRLSDRNVLEKAERLSGGNMGANRQIIYSITNKHNNWGLAEIRMHYDDIVNLLKKESIEEILTSKSP